MASSKSRPSTCVVGSVGSVEGNEVEEQRKAAWAWKRREEASEGAREKTGDGLLKEHMYGNDFNSMWEVLCLLEGRPNSEEELQKIRQGVPTRVESRHNLGAMEECLPREAVSWQRYIKRTRQGRRMGGPPEVEARTAEGGYNVAVYRESGERYRKWVEYGDGTPLDAGFLCTKRQAYAILWGVRSPRSDAAEVAAAVQGGLDNAQDRQEWPEEMPDRARHRSYQGMASASIGHLARLTGLAGNQWRTRCAKHSRKGIWRGPQSRGGHRGSCGIRSADVGAVPGRSAQGGDMGRGMRIWEVGVKQGMQNSHVSRVGTQGGQSPRQRRCCRAEDEGDTMNCCGYQKQRQWQRQRKET